MDGLRGFFEREMVSWAKSGLNSLIENFINNLRTELKRDLTKFYRSIDDFAYTISGEGTPALEDVDVFDRLNGVTTAIAIGGIGYAAAGAIFGMGSVNAIIGSLIGEVLAVGIFKNLLFGAGILSVLLIGWELWNFEDNATAKCKDAIQENFVDKMQEQKQIVCERYAHDIAYKLREQLKGVDDGLLVEIDRRRTIAQSFEADAAAKLSASAEFDGRNFESMEAELVRKVAALKSAIPGRKQRIMNLDAAVQRLDGQRSDIADIEI